MVLTGRVADAVADSTALTWAFPESHSLHPVVPDDPAPSGIVLSVPSLGRPTVISQRYLRGTVTSTTNRGVGACGEIFAHTTVATAMLDRLLHRSVVINITR